MSSLVASPSSDNIDALTDPREVPNRWQANKGNLVVGAEGIIFTGKSTITISQPVSVTRMHTGAWATDVLRVDHAGGTAPSPVYFAVAKRGRAGREVIDALEPLLTARVVGDGPRGADVHRQVVEQETRTATSRSRLLMIVGAVVLVMGLAVTIGTYAAADAGGTVIIAWGAVVTGLLLMIGAMVNITKVK